MPWQAVILLQNVFASIYALESRALAKRYQTAHFQILVTTFAIVYAVFLVYAALNSGQINFSIEPTYYAFAALVGLLFTIWTILTFITLRYVDAAVGTLLTVLNLLSVVIVSSYFLGERLSLLQGMGAILLLISILIIFATKQSKYIRRKTSIALILSLIASICFGLAISGEKYLLDTIGAPTYAIVGIGLQFLPLVLLAILYNRSQFKLFDKPEFRARVFLMGFVRGGAGLLFILSLVGANNASLVGVLSGFKIILTTLLAAILLKELTFIKRKLLASFIACVGVGLMLW